MTKKLLAVTLAASLAACNGIKICTDGTLAIQGGPPCPSVTPTPPPPPDKVPTPLCGPAKEDPHFDCWHDPDGKGWRYRCSDKLTDVADAKDCPVPPEPTGCVEKCPEGTHCDGKKCVPNVTAKCPAEMPMAARVFKIKVANYDPSTGKKVLDVTPRVDDQKYCEAVTGMKGVKSCKASPEGPMANHACDAVFLGYECPPWFYETADGRFGRCWHDGYNGGAPISCDHFERQPEQDDYTGWCETQPGTDPAGKKIRIPVNGFTVVPHGKGKVYACTSDGLCTAKIDVDF